MKERLQYLLDHYAAGTATAGEQQELFALISNATTDEEIKNYVQQLWNEWKPGEELPFPDWEKVYAAIRPAPVRKIFIGKRIAIAASVIFLLGFGIYFVIARREATKQSVPLAKTQDVKAPQTNRATITTSDGKTIYLDSVSNGTLATQNNVELIKTADGKINYELTANSSRLSSDVSRLTYHTLNNPKGSKVVDITLSDGSHVWLNAGSSITYPIAFIGKERKVTMTGEAYFEISHRVIASGAKQSFLVEANGTTTEVLGTHFNVNAYDDEDAVRVTLLEGSVVVKSEVGSMKSEVKIIPGEQAVLTHGSRLTTNSSSDLEQVMAWKNGRFEFGDKMDIQSIMRQLARWYDIDVEYKGKVNGLIGGSISREVNVSNVLSMLEKTGEVKFDVEGRKIIVLP